MSKEDRARAILIDGEPVASLDFGQMGLRILYAMAGETPPKEDLYAIPGLESADREGRKALVNALISTSKPLSRWPQNTKALFPKHLTAQGAVELISIHHARIASRFLRGAWGDVQRAESDIIVSVILRCAGRGIVALPVHDGVIVPRSRADETRAIMVQCFGDRLKTAALIPIKMDKDEDDQIIHSLAA